MPKERKDSASSADSDEGSSSGDDSSGSDSSSSDSGPESKTSSKRRSDQSPSSSAAKDVKGRGDQPRMKQGNKSSDEGSEHRTKSKGDVKGEREVRGASKHSDSGSEESSSDEEHAHKAGPRSTVVQKVSRGSKDKDAHSEDSRKTQDSRDKRDTRNRDDGHRQKRSRSRSPHGRDSDKRFKDDSGGDRRDDRHHKQDDRRDDKDRGRQRDRGSDRSSRGDRRRDDDRRRDSDRSRRDDDRNRSERRRDGGDRRDDRRRDDESRRDRDRDRRRNAGDKANSRREEDKENKGEEGESRKRKAEDEGSQDQKESGQPEEKKAKEEEPQLLTSRTGGAYIPPAKLRMMQAQITDKSSVAYQRMAWEALKKSINGLINKVNVSNIIDIVRELFQENIVRGRGLLARSIIQAQAASPTFTHVYAALVAIINTKFPQNGELILQRLILQFKRGFRRNDKNICLSSTRFIAHLVNQQVAHEVISLEILTLLLENATEDSVEVAISFLKEVGQKLTEVSPRGINAIFERLRSILHEGQLDKRVQYMVEVMFAIRKDGFKDHPAVIPDLDLVEEDDQFTHLLTLEDVTGGQELLNIFKPDPDYLENEERYKTLKKEILAEGSSDEEGSGDESGDESSSDEDDEDEEQEKQDIIDNTETNMVALRRTIYLTIQSSLDFEECAHKLLKMDLKPGQEVELCYMILDCCAQLRTYEKFFGLLAQRFCQLERKYVEPFQNIFREQFETIHRLDTNKLRNVAKFFGHLLHTDAISWGVLSCIKLTETDTTSASRIFIKILFLELSEYMGLPKLNARLRDPTLQEYFEGIMPRNNPKDTRFAINFFTTIGLGGLTEDLREHLKGMSKQLMQQKQQEEMIQNPESSSDSDSSDSDSSGSSDSSDSDSSSSDSDSSDSSGQRGKKKKRKQSSSRGKDKKSKQSSKSKDREESHRRDSRKRTEEATMNGRGHGDQRPRIEDKLLKLSMDGGGAPVSFGSSGRLQGEDSVGDRQERRDRGRNKSKKSNRLNLRDRRLSSNNANDRGRGGQNSDQDFRNSGYDHQGSEQVDWDRDYYRGEGGRARPQSPEMDGWREDRGRGGRRREAERSPQGDWEGYTRDYRNKDRSPARGDSPPPQRRDRMATPPRRQDRVDDDYQSARSNRQDMLSPPRRGNRRDVDSPPRGGRGDRASPRSGHRDVISPVPGNRRDVASPPPSSRRDIGSPRGSGRDVGSPPRNRRDMASPPRGNRRDMGSPPRNNRDMASPPQNRRDMASPPRSRRDMASPPRGRMDTPSPPRSRGRKEIGSPPSRGNQKNVDLSPQRGSRRNMGSPQWRGSNRDAESPPRRTNRQNVDRSPVGRDRREAAYDNAQNGKDRGEDRYSQSDRRGRDNFASSPPRNSYKERQGRDSDMARRQSVTPDKGKRGSRDRGERDRGGRDREREVSRERGGRDRDRDRRRR